MVLMLGGLSACKDDDPKDIDNGELNDESCEHHAECGMNEICAEGDCESAGSCASASSWDVCTGRAEELSPEEGWMYACVEGACTRMCVTDQDCDGEDEICSDFGSCIAYTGTLLPYDSGDNTPGELQAGVGEVLINAPIGVEMGGYGSRAEPNDGRYAVSLSASRGQMDAQYARAVVLDNGIGRLLLIRVPMVFSFSQMHERIAQNLQDETGVDWRDELIISSTHTHSGPTGFWRFPDETAIDPGMLGAGKFNQILEDWYVESLTQAGLEAIENKRDAKFGWKIEENYDPDDQVARDRWSSTPPFDMRRLLVMRVDDAANDEPMAVLFSYASHGTSNSKDYLTDDVLGGAEHGVSAALYEKYGRYIPTLYFSEAGGTISPSVGSFPYSRDYAAYRLSTKIMPVVGEITTSRSIGMRSRAYRFNVSRERVGYTGKEFSSKLPGTLGGILHSGALMCTSKYSDDDDYSTHMNPDALSCIGNVRMIVHNHQPTPLTRSQITALELDGLHAVTLPGEPSQEIAWQVLREMRDRFELPTANNWIFGYVNDHLLYITPTNLRGDPPDVAGFVLDEGMTSLDDYPDYAFSYLQGGYEAEMTPWGPKSGDFIVDRAVDAVTWLHDEAAVPSEHAPNLPTQYTRIETPHFGEDVTPDDEVGTILDDMPDDIARFETATFRWVGGDPGAEAPQSPLVTLEQKNNDGDWEDTVGPDGLPVTNRGLAMATRLKIVDQDAGSPTYEWSVYWQPMFALDEGAYRFRVDGNYLSSSRNDRRPYTTESQEFEVLANASGSAAIQYDPVDQTFIIHPTYPALVSLEQNTDEERAKLSGALRLIDPRVPFGQPISMTDAAHALSDGGYIDETSVLISGSFEDETKDFSNISCADIAFDCSIQTTVSGLWDTPTTTVHLDLPNDYEPIELSVLVQDSNGNAAVGEWSID